MIIIEDDTNQEGKIVAKYQFISKKDIKHFKLFQTITQKKP